MPFLVERKSRMFFHCCPRLEKFPENLKHLFVMLPSYRKCCCKGSTFWICQQIVKLILACWVLFPSRSFSKIGQHFRSINQLCQVQPNINKLTKYFNFKAMDLEFLKGNLSRPGWAWFWQAAKATLSFLSQHLDLNPAESKFHHWP